MPHSFDWVDAFTNHAFGGNGCVVVHEADDMSEADRMALVRETSLSECAFIVESDVADFGARYYLADKEILMACHPTIATVASLIDRGVIDLSGGEAEFTLEVGAGVLPIKVTGRGPDALISMTQPAPEFGAIQDKSVIAAMYGLNEDDIIAPPQIVSTGTPFCITLLRDKEALRRACLDVDAWAALNPPGTPRADLIEPFLVTLGGETEAGHTFSRLLLPAPMPPEDPFTGSATGCMAAYLWRHNFIETSDFRAEQGHWMGRPGMAHVRVLGSRDAPTGVEVAGQGKVLMWGILEV